MDNIMDTDATTVKSETNLQASIENLPILVMKKIFKFLPTSDRETAMQVCWQWYNIINLEVGRTVYIGKLVYNFPGYKSVTWKSLQLITRVGIDKCCFAEMLELESSDYGNEKNKEGSFQGLMVPELLKELSFCGKISNKLFRAIVAPTHRLTSLKIHLSAFRFISFENYALRLCCLTRLVIFYTHPIFHLSFPFREDDPSAKAAIHNNLIQFLRTCSFPRIQIFEFRGPYFVEETKNLTNAVRAFVRKHQVSLEELVLSFPFEWNLNTVNQQRERDDESEINNNNVFAPSASISPEERAREPFWGNVQLRRLQVVCPATIVPAFQPFHPLVENLVSSSWIDKSFSEMWRSLLVKQCNMSSIQYVNKFEDWSFPKAIFLNNAHSLKVVSLSVNSNYGVDCRVLSCCENLTKLTLEGNYFHVENVLHQQHDYNNNNNNVGNNAADTLGRNNAPEEEGIGMLFNAYLLPDSLEDICLSKLLIPVTEMETLVDAMWEAKRFPNLGSLQLYQICRGWPQFGLSVAVVRQLLDQSNLSVSLWQALDCTTFESAISKAVNKVTTDSDVVALMKMLQHCDMEEEDHEPENLRFATLYDCHVQLIRK